MLVSLCAEAPIKVSPGGAAAESLDDMRAGVAIVTWRFASHPRILSPLLPDYALGLFTRAPSVLLLWIKDISLNRAEAGREGSLSRFPECDNTGWRSPTFPSTDGKCLSQLEDKSVPRGTGSVAISRQPARHTGGRELELRSDERARPRVQPFGRGVGPRPKWTRPLR